MPNQVDTLKSEGYFEMLRGSFAGVAAIEIDPDIVRVCEKRTTATTTTKAKEKQTMTNEKQINSKHFQQSNHRRLESFFYFTSSFV